jgi:hypothetical protein
VWHGAQQDVVVLTLFSQRRHVLGIRKPVALSAEKKQQKSPVPVGKKPVRKVQSVGNVQ